MQNGREEGEAGLATAAVGQRLGSSPLAELTSLALVGSCPQEQDVKSVIAL